VYRRGQILEQNGANIGTVGTKYLVPTLFTAQRNAERTAKKQTFVIDNSRPRLAVGPGVVTDRFRGKIEFCTRQAKNFLPA
jgi:hypothetical protein